MDYVASFQNWGQQNWAQSKNTCSSFRNLRSKYPESITNKHWIPPFVPNTIPHPFLKLLRE